MNEVDRDNLRQLDTKRQELKTELDRTQQEHQRILLKYLGAEPTAPLSTVAEEILRFAESEGINPRWFYGQVNQAATHVQGFSPNTIGIWRRDVPIAQTSEQFYNCAIHNIRSQVGDLKQADGIVTEAFTKAKQEAHKAENFEDSQRMSKVYGWLNSNRDFLYKIHGEYWRSHNVESSTVYGRPKPEKLDPVELTPILEEEVNSIEEKVASVADPYQGGPALTLARDLERFGFKVTYDIESSGPYFHDDMAKIGEWRFIRMGEAVNFFADFQQRFEDRLGEVLTDSQKSKIDIYRHFLNPVKTPLTIGVHGLEFPKFVGAKPLYMVGVDVGFNMLEAAQIVEWGLAQNLLSISEGGLTLFLATIDILRKEQKPGNNWYIFHPIVQHAVDDFMESDQRKLLDRPIKLKQLYEEHAYKIYGLG